MHSDSGGEFINKNLDKFLKGKGVKQTVSTPHTSEHNRVAERMLRSIISIARCLLIHSGLSQQFWCEAVQYACLVHSARHKSSGWYDTNGTLEWCKARCECFSHFQVQMLQGRVW
jgi:hypothetical protein